MRMIVRNRLHTSCVHVRAVIEEGETPRRARAASIWHFGLDFAVLFACSRRCQTGLPDMRLDTEDHRVEGEFPCNNL